MKNHLNILPKQASFDLKCSKMRWWLGLGGSSPDPAGGTSLRRSPDPLIVTRKGHRALGARHSLFRVRFKISIPLPGPFRIEFLDPPLVLVNVESSLYINRDKKNSCCLFLEGQMDAVHEKNSAWSVFSIGLHTCNYLILGHHLYSTPIESNCR